MTIATHAGKTKQSKTIQKHSTAQLQKQKLPQIRDLMIGKAKGVGEYANTIRSNCCPSSKG